MKKIIISTAALVFAAASAFAQVNVGAGYSGTRMNPSKGDSQWYNGFNVSAGYNLPLGLGFEFSPSIEYNFLTSSKDVTVGAGSASATSKNRFNEHYLNVPLMFNYGYDITPDARIFVFAGPTASFGLYAEYTTKLEASIGGNSGSTDKKTVSLWGDDSDYKRFDVKIGGGVGIDICRHYRIQVGYDYGLLNRTETDGMSLHHHSIKAGVAYMF